MKKWQTYGSTYSLPIQSEIWYLMVEKLFGLLGKNKEII